MDTPSLIDRLRKGAEHWRQFSNRQTMRHAEMLDEAANEILRLTAERDKAQPPIDGPVYRKVRDQILSLIAASFEFEANNNTAIPVSVRAAFQRIAKTLKP